MGPFRRNIVILSGMMLLPVLLAAACGTQSATDGNAVAPRTKSYRNDGYMGLTNANPNLITSPSYHTYERETDMMEKAATSVAKVKGVRITLNGSTAHVMLRTDAVTEEERVAIRGEVLQALKLAVPSFSYDITFQS